MQISKSTLIYTVNSSYYIYIYYRYIYTTFLIYFSCSPQKGNYFAKYKMLMTVVSVNW